MPPLRNNKIYSSPFDRKARIVGWTVTILFHLALLLVCIDASLSYPYPPPEEVGILLDFQQDEPKPVSVKIGVEPRAQKAEPEKEIQLVQKSESPVKGSEINKSTESTLGTQGDVETPEPPRPKPIDRRSLFSSNKNSNDTLAQQVAKDPSNKMSGGHPKGNTAQGRTDGVPSAQLEGRTVMGNLPIPAYSVQKAGSVVVTIMVDQYGKVTNAIPGAKGTTVQDATLWEAARKAALEAKFNTSSSAPSVQRGTITYIFKLE